MYIVRACTPVSGPPHPKQDSLKAFIVLKCRSNCTERLYSVLKLVMFNAFQQTDERTDEFRFVEQLSQVTVYLSGLKGSTTRVELLTISCAVRFLFWRIAFACNLQVEVRTFLGACVFWARIHSPEAIAKSVIIWLYSPRWGGPGHLDYGRCSAI